MYNIKKANMKTTIDNITYEIAYIESINTPAK